MSLTPELEAFLGGCVASGRYADADEVMRAARRLLERQEARREAFTAMLERAEREADEIGWFTIDEVFEDLRADHEARMKAEGHGA